MLNQHGVDTLNDMAQALLGYPGDAEAACTDLMAAYNQYGEGLGLFQSQIEEIIREYLLALQGVSQTVIGVSKKMTATANRMQAFVNSAGGGSSDDDGHGTMDPKQKSLRRK